MPDWTPDPPIAMPIPDPELAARVQRWRMKQETEMQRFVRQRWEETLAGLNVAIGAWRQVWPALGAEFLSETERYDAQQAIGHIYTASVLLDSLAVSMVGEEMRSVMLCETTTHEALTALGVPQ